MALAALQAVGPRRLFAAAVLLISVSLALVARVSASAGDATVSSSIGGGGGGGGNGGGFAATNSMGRSAGSRGKMMPEAMMASAPAPMMAMAEGGAAFAGSAGGFSADAASMPAPAAMRFASPPQPPQQQHQLGDIAARMRAAGAAADAESDASAPAAGGAPLVLRSGSVACELLEVGAAAARVAKEVAEAFGGFAESSSSRTDQWAAQRWEQYYRETLHRGDPAAAEAAVRALAAQPTHADFQLRVPAARFEAARAAARALAEGLGGRVAHEESSGVDVSEQHTDAAARERVDRRALAQLEALLAAAASVPEVLAVRREMDEVAARLESHAAVRKGLEGRAAMSSLAVSLARPQPPQPQPQPQPPPPAWSAGAALGAALGALAGAAQAAAEVCIFAAVFAVPVAAALGVVFVVGKRVARALA